MILQLIKYLYVVPVLGRLLQEAFEGPDEALLTFIANIVMSLLIAVILFGFSILLPVALTAVVLMFAIIFDITIRDI